MAEPTSDGRRVIFDEEFLWGPKDDNPFTRYAKKNKQKVERPPCELVDRFHEGDECPNLAQYVTRNPYTGEPSNLCGIDIEGPEAAGWPVEPIPGALRRKDAAGRR